MSDLTPFFAMGKVIGGGSAVNGALALHARREDYAEWDILGNGSWAWESVKPWIDQFGQDVSYRPALPLHVARPEQWTRLQRAFSGACRALGFAEIGSASSGRSGYSVIPKNARDGRKVSSADLYLAIARGRRNLTILPHCHADKLIVAKSGHAEAVEVILDGVKRQFSAGRFVLAAGAVHSPAVLLRSGIGAAASLEKLSIEPRIDLPGVGCNLIDHATVSLWGVPQPGSYGSDDPVHQLMLEQAGGNLADRRDLQLFMLGALPVDQFADLRNFVGADMAMGITVMLATPRSRGCIELSGVDPLLQPHIRLNCLEDEGDLERMMEGVRLAWRLLRQFSSADKMERSVLWSDAVIESEARLREAVLTLVNGAWHPVGSLRMGSSQDSMSVVDQSGSLYGCGNVTVADASIMPSIPGVPTNLTCMLVAERIAKSLLKGGMSVA